MLHPIRNSHSQQPKPILGTWGQTSFAQAYEDLFPMSNFRRFHDENVDNGSGTRTTLIPHTHNSFNTGIMTVNFFTPMHIDQADGYALTHCLYSPPEWWMKPSEGPAPNSVFSLGKCVFSLSDHPLQINFLDNHSFHSTGIPSDVAINPPQSLV